MRLDFNQVDVLYNHLLLLMLYYALWLKYDCCYGLFVYDLSQTYWLGVGLL